MATTDSATGKIRPGGILVSVLDDGRPVAGASCSLYYVSAKVAAAKDAKGTTTWEPSREQYVTTRTTGRDGHTQFADQPPGCYMVLCHHEPRPAAEPVEVEPGCVHEACVDIGLDVGASTTLHRDDCTPITCGQGRVGDLVDFRIFYKNSEKLKLRVQHPSGARPNRNSPLESTLTIPAAGLNELRYAVFSPYVAGAPGAPARADDARIAGAEEVEANERTPQPITGSLGVALSRTATAPTADVAFWRALVNSTEGLSFNTYLRFMDHVLCGENGLNDLPAFEQDRFGLKRGKYGDLRPLRLLPFTDSDAYRVVKAATEAFVMINCGVLTDPQPFDSARDDAYLQRRDLPVPVEGLKQVFGADYLVDVVGGDEGAKTLPYLAVIRSKLPDIAIKLAPLEAPPDQVSKCHGILQDKLANPCLIELIWSYWQEEGMLVQTMNAIARRFQNVRSQERDPLANLEIDPLRPLNNVLWGYVQDEQHRLSIVRRNYEYDHHYGLRLEGKAVARMQAADSRSRFLEAFHNLLRLCAAFFKQDDDTTIKADAFPVLNALKEVHLILSQGAHNQFGDLPSTARIEMLMQQWLLARPEFREFLPTRIMTAYPEPWMDRVDAMKKLQGWTDTSVLDFRNLAIFGEQLLLSIRWGHWSDVQEPLQAFNWVRFFRPQIQGYNHAYRAVTGVDLSSDLVGAKVDATLPSVLLQRRLATQPRSV